MILSLMSKKSIMFQTRNFFFLIHYVLNHKTLLVMIIRNFILKISLNIVVSYNAKLR